MLLSIIINICILAEPSGNVNLELNNPSIPWFRSTEYIIQTDSEDLKNCPEWKNLHEDIEIAEKPVQTEGTKGCVKKVIIDPLKSGNFLIPSAIVKGEDGKTWKTSAFVLKVREPTEEEVKEIQNVADIIKPEMKKPLTNQLLIGLIAVGTLLLIIGLVYYLRKHFARGPLVPEIMELPWEKAFRRLRDLKSKDFPSQGMYEQYYVQLTWILRYYIEDRFNIHAPEQTTPEFMKTTMEKKVLTPEQQKFLYSFLNHCDKVKFAQLIPTPEQMESGFNWVWNFIEETKATSVQEGTTTESMKVN